MTEEYHRAFQEAAEEHGTDRLDFITCQGIVVPVIKSTGRVLDFVMAVGVKEEYGETPRMTVDVRLPRSADNQEEGSGEEGATPELIARAEKFIADHPVIYCETPPGKTIEGVAADLIRDLTTALKKKSGVV